MQRLSKLQESKNMFYCFTLSLQIVPLSVNAVDRHYKALYYCCRLLILMELSLIFKTKEANKVTGKSVVSVADWVKLIVFV